MKILHTSDWHLGATDADRSLIEDQRYFIDEICRVVKENDVQVVVIAGDVYDRSVSSAEAISLYDYAMKRLCLELQSKVVIVAGNHDSAERLSSCRDLLSAAGLYICGQLEKDLKPVSIGDTDFYPIPWITEEKVKSLFPEQKNEIDSVEKAYSVVTEKIRESFDHERKHFAIAHAFITDTETSTSDKAAEIGFATQVSAKVFDGFDYVALGHLHKPQDVTDKIRYSGTPMPYSFGKEETQEKSVTLIDTGSMEHMVIPLKLLHCRRTFTGTLEDVFHPVCTKEEQEGYVRVQVTDSYVGLETLSKLRELYPNLLESAGKTYESDTSSVTLTIEELEQLEENPVDVFRYFCRDTMKEEPDAHLVSLFEEAVKAVGEGENHETAET